MVKCLIAKLKACKNAYGLCVCVDPTEPYRFFPQILMTHRATNALCLSVWQTKCLCMRKCHFASINAEPLQLYISWHTLKAIESNENVCSGFAQQMQSIIPTSQWALHGVTTRLKCITKISKIEFKTLLFPLSPPPSLFSECTLINTLKYY